MTKLRLPLPLAALLAMVVSCGPSGSDLKMARDTRYKGDPAMLYAAARQVAEGDYKTASSDDGAFVYRSVARWYTPEGQLDSTGGKNVASLQQDSINFAVVIKVVKADADTYTVNVEPVALRLHGLSSNPDALDMNDPSVPGWVHGKVESLQVHIYEKLKGYAVPTTAAPASGPGSAAPPPAAAPAPSAPPPAAPSPP